MRWKGESFLELFGKLNPAGGLAVEVRPYAAARHETYEIFNIVHLCFLEGTIPHAEVACQGISKK